MFNTASTSANVSYQLNSNINLVGSISAQLSFSHIAAFEGSSTSYDFGLIILQMGDQHGISLSMQTTLELRQQQSLMQMCVFQLEVTRIGLLNLPLILVRQGLVLLLFCGK